MANIKWSEFTDGGEMQVGDQTVGLRVGDNFRFTFPGTGIKDVTGNYLMGWASPGTLAVNYLQLNSSVTGSAPFIVPAGSDTNINLLLTSKGNGNINLTPAGTGVINTSSALILNTSSPTTALQAASKGYVDGLMPSYPIALNLGGTGASLTASNGGIFYSTSSAGAILAGTATARQVLLSGLSSAPSWSSATYPSTTTANQILYSSATNTIVGLSTANGGILVTSNSGVPSILATSGVSGNILTSSAAAAPVWSTSTYSDTYTANNLLYASSTNTVSGLATANNGVLITSGAGAPSISSTLPSAVQGNITSVGTIGSGTWNGSLISGQYGGTGVNNGASLITVGGNFTMSGGFTFTGTLTGNTSVTFPTSGTLATTASLPSLPLSLANGGTNANLTASNGGIFYSGATAGAILAGTSTANQILLSGSNTAPAWSTATYPATSTINQLLYSSANNTIGGLATINNSVLVTSASGVPTWLGSLTDGQLIIGSTGNIPVASTLTAGSNISITNAAGSITISATSGGSGTVNTGTANQLAYYATTGAAVSGLASSNNGVLVTDGSGVPNISSTLPSAVQGNITTVGIVGSGTWNGSLISVPFGGSGASSFTAYSVICGGTTSTSPLQNVSGLGSSGQVLTSNGAGALPSWQAASGGVTSVSGTTNRITSTGGSTPVIDIAATYVGQTSITTLGTISTGTWQGTIIGGTYGGTGVNNGASTITLGGSLTTSGPFSSTFTMTGATSVTFPTSGTLATTANIPSLPLSLSNGGTNANLTASNGGIVYSGASAFAVLSGTATSNQVLLSGTSSAPSWSTATYPATTTVSQLLYSSSANTVTGLSTANNGVLITSNTGVPSWLANSGTAGFVLTANSGAPPSWQAASGGVSSVSGTTNRITSTGGATPVIDISASYIGQSSITTLGTIGTGTWQGTVIGSIYGGTGVNNGASTITLGGSLTTSGAFSSTFTMTGATSVTFPTSGTLATTASIPSLPLSLANGGTNASLTASNGGIVYSGASAFAVLAGTATAGQVLQSGASGAPSWSTPTYPSSSGGLGKHIASDGTNNNYTTSTYSDTYAASTLLYSNGANTVTGLATANSAVLVTNSSGVPAWSGTMTNGQVIIGNTSGTPTAATLTAGTGVSITNASGSITIGIATGGMTWTTVSGTSQSAAVNNGYVTNNSGQVTVTLPATCAVGDRVAVEGLGTGGWKVVANTGQTITAGNFTTTSGGNAVSNAPTDNIYLICIVANTGWKVQSTFALSISYT